MRKAGNCRMTIEYQIPEEEDGEAIYQMMVELDKETRYMLYEVGERQPNLPMLVAAIHAAQKQQSFFMVAKSQGEIIGYIMAQRRNLTRIAHVGYVVIGIRKAYQGQGIGTALFQRLDLWAREQNLLRLELTVVAENQAGVKLYEKSGFHREGIKEKAMLVDGNFLDELYMAKLYPQIEQRNI